METPGRGCSFPLMPLAAGTRLGPYEVLGAIGAGGMGEVYRGQDTRLNRTVAIKVLPHHLAARTEARERFEREARAISSLNHPHICSLYDIGRQDGIDFLVMEHLEGATLAERLEKGALPQDQALRYGAQILDALDRAHRNGIVHRDLKPANVMITRDGAKLLDFGLAKLREASVPEQTVSMTLTTEGSIVGTFQYMAPEQLEGKAADARTDIFAFGAVLYEMLTGRKAFAGKSQASLISSIMTSSPAPVSSVQPLTPPGLDRLVERCLRKDPEERWQSARDLAEELKWVAEGGAPAALPSPGARQPKRLAAAGWIAAGVLALLLAAVGVFEMRRGADVPPPPVRFQIPLPKGATWTSAGMPAVSPDGSRIVFSAYDESLRRIVLFLRALDSTAVQSLPGTDGAQGAFWSPDSKQVAFFSGGRLRKIAIAGGSPEIVCEMRNAVFPNGTWGRQGVMLVAFNGGPLFQVSDQGGDLKPATQLDAARGETSHGGPQFLPDGKHFVFQAASRTSENAGLYVGSLDSRDKKRLLATNFNAALGPPGLLVFPRGDMLAAQRFDSQSGRLEGEAIPLASQVWNLNVTSSAADVAYACFSSSATGVLAYRTGEFQQTPLVWFDRRGKRIETVGEPAQYSNPTLSPDGKRLAIGRTDAQGRKRDIWVIDLVRGGSSRFTFDPADDMNPVWSPDGTRIAFSSDRKGVRDLYVKPMSGGEEELVAQSDIQKSLLDWSPDGRTLMYHSGGKVWGLALAEPKPRVIFGDGHQNYQATLSPDGKWVAYRSNETGWLEIYVQSLASAGGKWQISNAGGSEPYWRRDGKELFYIGGNALMAVSIASGPSGFEHGTPVKLFESAFTASTSGRNRYVASADGQRFLIVSASDQASSSPIEVVMNWPALVKH